MYSTHTHTNIKYISLVYSDKNNKYVYILWLYTLSYGVVVGGEGSQ